MLAGLGLLCGIVSTGLVRGGVRPGGLTVAPEELPCLDDRRVAGECVGHAELCVVVADWKTEDWRRDGQRRGCGSNKGKDGVGHHSELLWLFWRQ